MGKDSSFAFVTLATDDKYSIGARVLAHSLKKVDTKADLVVLITSGVSKTARTKLDEVFDLVEDVTEIDSKDSANLSKLERPELGVTFTKIHCWKLTQYTKCVFLDADTLVLKNCDELFDRPELSAVADVGWPDCFNSGVFVFEPSLDTYIELITLAAEKGSFDGGDQGLLNMYFSDWSTKDINCHLSFAYNMSISSFYSYLPAFEKYGKDVKIVHFLGNQKPWTYKYNPDTKHVENVSHPLEKFLKMWWQTYTEHVDEERSGVEKDLAQMSVSDSSTSDPKGKKGASCDPKKVPSDEERMSAWEQGKADYLGADSYDKIEKKLDEVMESKDSDEKGSKKKK